jgi:ferric-dicitrate binding protein FerR (iron transport regulator)
LRFRIGALERLQGMTCSSPSLADHAPTHLVGLYAGGEEAARRAEAWREADPAHESAWRAAERTWTLLGALGDNAATVQADIAYRRCALGRLSAIGARA